MNVIFIIEAQVLLTVLLTQGSQSTKYTYFTDGEAVAQGRLSDLLNVAQQASVKTGNRTQITCTLLVLPLMHSSNDPAHLSIHTVLFHFKTAQEDHFG